MSVRDPAELGNTECLVSQDSRGLKMFKQAHPCLWWGHWVSLKQAWVLPSTPAPGCYVVWQAAQWFPLSGYAALSHTGVHAAISCCESQLGPRSLDMPLETHMFNQKMSNESFILSKDELIHSIIVVIKKISIELCKIK